MSKSGRRKQHSSAFTKTRRNLLPDIAIQQESTSKIKSGVFCRSVALSSTVQIKDANEPGRTLAPGY